MQGSATWYSNYYLSLKNYQPIHDGSYGIYVVLYMTSPSRRLRSSRSLPGSRLPGARGRAERGVAPNQPHQPDPGARARRRTRPVPGARAKPKDLPYLQFFKCYLQINEKVAAAARKPAR